MYILLGAPMHLGCLVATVGLKTLDDSSTHTPPLSCNQSISETLPDVPWEVKSLVESHWDKPRFESQPQSYDCEFEHIA